MKEKEREDREVGRRVQLALLSVPVFSVGQCVPLPRVCLCVQGWHKRTGVYVKDRCEPLDI